MDFEVGSWTTSKKSDDLNDKLFGQSFTKLKKSENPLSGALAKEEVNSKKKKKKKKPGKVEERPKPKTKEEAIALRKAKKNQNRKEKQRLIKFNARIQKDTNVSESGPDKPESNGKGIHSSTAKKSTNKPNENNSAKNSKSPITAHGKQKTPNGKKSKGRTPQQKPKKERNKYKHLAMEKKTEKENESEDVSENASDSSPSQKLNKSSNVKPKRKTLENDSDEDIANDTPKKKKKKQLTEDSPVKYKHNDSNEDSGKDTPKKKKTKQKFTEGSSVKYNNNDSDEESAKDSPKKKKKKEKLTENSPVKYKRNSESDLSAEHSLNHSFQDSSMIEADNRKVEVVDMHDVSMGGASAKSKKKNKKLNDQGEAPSQPPLKKKKQKNLVLSVEDFGNVTPISKSAKKEKFDLTKLKSMLHKDPVKDEEKMQKTEKRHEDTAPKSLKSKMMEQLNSARFRFINEQLYTSTSEEAVAMMKDDPEAFDVYHQGFQAQVSKWPSNPLDLMISYLNERPKSLVVADLGCGDGLLAESVKQKVFSFDLVSTKKGIIACDIAEVPLANGAVDVSIFCLSLMGTNLVDFVTEAHRITKKGGILLVAEVLSRFEKLSNFIRKMGKLGFSLLSKNESNKMFVWMEFKKAGIPDKERLPKLELAPCSYKKR